MKKYQENENGDLSSDGEGIPKSHPFYVKVLREAEAGEAEIIAYDSSNDDQAKAIVDYKASRMLAVSQIEVTVDGMVFDGDEIAQGRMARAILAMQLDESTLWKLKDNTVASVTKVQLKEALKVAGMIQTELWFE